MAYVGSRVAGRPLLSKEPVFCGFFCLFVFVFCLFAFSRATPEAYGGSQARRLIGAVATGLHQSHSNAKSTSHVCDLHHSSRQRWILNPLSKARDRTCNLMVPSQIR